MLSICTIRDQEEDHRRPSIALGNSAELEFKRRPRWFSDPDDAPLTEDFDVTFTVVDPQLLLVCKQLYEEFKSQVYSSKRWSYWDHGPKGNLEEKRALYFEKARSIRVTDNFTFGLPAFSSINLETIVILSYSGRYNTLAISNDPKEAHQHFNACIALADRSFLAKQRKLLLTLQWVNDLVALPGRLFAVQHELEVVSQGRYSLVCAFQTRSRLILLISNRC